MKDINFFESYIEKKEFKLDKKIIFIVVIGIIFMFLSIQIAYKAFLIVKEKRQIEIIKEEVENIETLNRVRDIKEKELELENIKNSIDSMKKLDQYIMDRDIINGNLLAYITGCMPEDLFLTSFSIYDRSIQLIGISKDRWSIAEFGKGLEVLESYDEIFISNISFQDDFYNFEIHIDLGGGEEDGKETFELIPDEEDEENKNSKPNDQ